MSIGGGKSSGSQSDPAAARLANLAEMFATETSGIRGGLISNMMEVLKTGGSRLPIISQAVETSRQAGSKALSETENELARTGLAGTPFGERIRGEQMTQSNLAAAGTRNEFIANILNQIQPFVLGQSGTAAAGMGGAVGGNVKAKGKSAGFGK